MAVLKGSAVIAFEIVVYLIIGLMLTVNVVKVIYEHFGILFSGNVWVNWFGISFLLYFIYTIIRRLFFQKNNELYKERTRSIIFWLLFIVAIYVVFFPFVKGENPF